MTSNTHLIKKLRGVTFASYIDCATMLRNHDGDYDKALQELRTIGFSKAEEKADRETEEGLVIIKHADDTVCGVLMKCETDFAAVTTAYKHLAHRIAEQVIADKTLTSLESVLETEFIDTPGETIAQAVKELAGKLEENISLADVVRYETRPNSVIDSYVHVGALDGYGPMEGRMGVILEVAVEDPACVDMATLMKLAHSLALHIASSGPTYVSTADIPTDVLESKKTEIASQSDDLNKPEVIQAKIIAGRMNKFYTEACLLNQFYLDEEFTVDELLRQKGEAFGTPVSVKRFARLGLRY